MPMLRIFCHLEGFVFCGFVLESLCVNLGFVNSKAYTDITTSQDVFFDIRLFLCILLCALRWTNDHCFTGVFMYHKIFAVTVASILTLTACSQEQRESAAQQATETLKLDHEDVLSLKIGQCFDNTAELTTEEQIASLPIRDCAAPHDNEIFFIHKYPDAPAAPTSQQLDEDAQKHCIPAFQSFVGKDFHSSEIEMAFLTPSTDSWAAGDRDLVCYVFDGKGKTTGSFKDSKR